MRLFGPEIAFRQGGKILISDLDDDDLATLDANSLVCLPKDDAGRGVIFSRRQGWSYRVPINVVSVVHKNVDQPAESNMPYHRNETTNTIFFIFLPVVATGLVSGPCGDGGSFDSKKWYRGNPVQCG